MSEPVEDLLAREHQFLRDREGAEFFLAIEPYMAALRSHRRIRKAIARLERETQAAAGRYVAEQNEFIAEAVKIREELASRAPEIDNSDMERPDPASHDYMRWDLDSLARFDDFIERDSSLRIGFPAVPGDNDDPGIFSQLDNILRGRLRAATYGEGALGFNAPQIRDDLDDLGARLGNLARRHEHARTRYRQEARTLAGLAILRLGYFGSDLNPAPVVIETNEDLERWLDTSLREWGTPKTNVRALVNGQQMDDGERESALGTTTFLKGELDRLHQELARRVPHGPNTLAKFALNPWVVGIGSAIAAAVAVALIFYAFDIARSESTPPATTTPPTSVTQPSVQTTTTRSPGTTTTTTTP